MNKEKTYCGHVTIVGRTNVGKSTLLNKLVGQKISITSKKPQTTRSPIIGIHTVWPHQTIYTDTPGLHIVKKQEKNYSMNRIINNDFFSSGFSIFVVEGTYWTPDDEIVAKKLRDIGCQTVLVVNKVDRVVKKEKLLPHITFLTQQMNFHSIVPICAQNGMNINTLLDVVQKALPESKHTFPENYITHQSRELIASEIIREKLMRFLGDELPYSVTVTIKNFFINNRNYYNIHAVILVKHIGQKKIIIGSQGVKIKTIGTEARKSMEDIFNIRVYLKLLVKK